MRKYLATLHKKPESHRRRFALLASSTITLFIFSIWSLVNFGLPENRQIAQQEMRNVEEVSPFDSLRAGVGAAVQSLRGGFGEVKQGLEQVDFGSEYELMRGRAFETYGR